MMYYIFDGTYAGLLSCVFESFERKELNIVPLLKEDYQMDVFSGHRIINTDMVKAKRVRAALFRKVGNVATDFYRAFLSEDGEAWLVIVRILQQIFSGRENVLQNYGSSEVIYFSSMLQKVGRESHRMKAFVRFQKSSNGLYVATIEPDFNVLPLILTFFRKRYADQCWLIYDVRRRYGIHFDKYIASEVRLSEGEAGSLSKESSVILDETDLSFQQLWKSYFNSTNIEARRNMKLHLQHVPKRYWKYLSEKQ